MRRGAWIPPVDIYDSGKQELVIKAELPDMQREDIQLTVDNNTLTISGEKKMDAELKEENCHRVERAYGTFTRSFSLPPATRRSNTRMFWWGISGCAAVNPTWRWVSGPATCRTKSRGLTSRRFGC